MSYLTQARLAADPDIMNRVTACAATQGLTDPAGFVQQRLWVLSAQPGWVGKYASAIARGIEEPGADEEAITDGDILAAVQAIADAETPPEPLPDPAE